MTLLNILLFIAVLSVLIFVHELGHFLAAKACGIYVDRFSIGMPPRLLGIKWGETDYCIGMLPLGGYVKMAGQEDSPLTDEEREETYGHVPPDRWFSTKPKWQRATVLAAGPLMNLLLGFVIYAVMVGVGGEVPLVQYDNRVGLVEADSPASAAPLFLAAAGEYRKDFSETPDAVGWETGDRIVSIDRKKVGRINDVAIEAALGAGKTVVVEIERVTPDGETLRYLSPVEPKVMEGSELARFGISPFTTALVSHVLPGSPAEDRGIQGGDIITRVNGNRVDKISFSETVRNLAPGTELDLEIQREDETLHLAITPKGAGQIEGISFFPYLNPFLLLADDATPEILYDDEAFSEATGLAPGDKLVSLGGETRVARQLRQLLASPASRQVSVTLENSDRQTRSFEVTLAQLIQGLTASDEDAPPVIAGITAEAKEATKLQRKDILLEIDGQPATAALLREIELTRVGETIAVKVKRPSVFLGLYKPEAIVEGELTATSVPMVGVVWGTQTVFRRSPPAEVLPEALAQCYRTTAQTGQTLYMLVTGGLSPKHVGGPVMIFQLTALAAKTGIMFLLDIVALISINLFLINLLPLPVLDGGQLFFLGIEAVRRKPVNIKVMEMVQQAGIVLIIGFMLYVTFNDVSRLVTNMIP